MASMAADAASGSSEVCARCFKENRARNRTVKGVASEQRLSLRLEIVESAMPTLGFSADKVMHDECPIRRVQSKKFWRGPYR